MTRSTILTVATNNVRSLPRNRRVRETLAATPSADVIAVQEVDLPSFKRALRDVPGKTLVPLPAGDVYNAAILYNARTATLRGHRYELQFRGAAKIAKTRHYAVARFYLPAIEHEVVVISWHAVTAGSSPAKVRRRRAARVRIAREVARYVGAGVPVIVAGDANQMRAVWSGAQVVARHGIDHVYAWDGGAVRWALIDRHTVPTASDHDALIVRLRATAVRD